MRSLAEDHNALRDIVHRSYPHRCGHGFPSSLRFFRNLLRDVALIDTDYFIANFFRCISRSRLMPDTEQADDQPRQIFANRG